MTRISVLPTVDSVMLDITEPERVDVEIRNDGTVLWVNVDGVCRLRCNKVKSLGTRDNRTHEVRQGSSIHLVDEEK